VKYWRGEYVIVFPGRRVKFQTCVVYGRRLRFDSPASETRIRPECGRKPATEVEQTKQRALEGDRTRYRREVSNLGFTIE
jgi:hypothetical protein